MSLNLETRKGSPKEQAALVVMLNHLIRNKVLEKDHLPEELMATLLFNSPEEEQAALHGVFGYDSNLLDDPVYPEEEELEELIWDSPLNNIVPPDSGVGTVGMVKGSGKPVYQYGKGWYGILDDSLVVGEELVPLTEFAFLTLLPVLQQQEKLLEFQGDIDNFFVEPRYHLELGKRPPPGASNTPKSAMKDPMYKNSFRFLSAVANSPGISHVIYVGAGPFRNTPSIRMAKRFFPSVHVTVIDQFLPSGTFRSDVSFKDEYFGPKLYPWAQDLCKTKKVLFYSDVFPKIEDIASEDQKTELRIQNMQKQIEWVQVLQPAYADIKVMASAKPFPAFKRRFYNIPFQPGYETHQFVCLPIPETILVEPEEYDAAVARKQSYSRAFQCAPTGRHDYNSFLVSKIVELTAQRLNRGCDVVRDQILNMARPDEPSTKLLHYVLGRNEEEVPVGRVLSYYSRNMKAMISTGRIHLSSNTKNHAKELMEGLFIPHQFIKAFSPRRQFSLHPEYSVAITGKHDVELVISRPDRNDKYFHLLGGMYVLFLAGNAVVKTSKDVTVVYVHVQ